MKSFLSFCRKAGLFTGLAVLFGAALARADLPVIQSIKLEGTNVVINVHVPSGLVRVMLESRGHLGTGAWVPTAVQRVSGLGGTINFRLPRSADFTFLRVRADATEPLPASFYTGANSFETQPASGGRALDGLYATGVPSGANSSTSREVVESDIWRLDGDTLYFFNQNRGLQVIDVANPDAAKLLGTLSLPAAGEQMYLLPPNHVVLLTRGACNSSDSEVLIVAVSNGIPAVVASLPVAGTIMESRLVGTALYLAAQTSRPVPGSTNTTWEWASQIASFDLAVPAAPVSRSSLWYSGYNNVIYATDTCLFAVTQHPNNGQRSVVNVIDITASDGTMKAYYAINPAGRVADKFKVNLSGTVFSVISEISGPPLKTKLETFHLPDPRSVPAIGIYKLGQVELGHGERLFATRIEGERAYVVTFLQIDPLWVVDLSNPSNPRVSGELQVPGWSTFIQPLGDQLVTVGIETNRATVSLFDVSDPSRPALLSRVPLGSQYSSTEANWDEKAFTVLEDAGLILLPVQGYTTNGYSTWVQLIDLGSNSLTARGIIEHDIVPRRATLHRDRIVSLSSVELLSVDAADRDHPQFTGQLDLAWPINRVLVAGDYLIEIATGDAWNGEDKPAVHVASAVAPDDVLTTLTLTNAPIAGATIRSNRLYLAQALTSTIVKDTNTPATSLWLTVVDLSSLPALNVLGQTAVATASLGWNSELEPVWPKPDLLVWAGGGNNYYWWGPWDVIAFGGPIRGGLWWPYGQSSGGGRLFAFDVSANSPALVSEVDLTTNGWWSFSKPFAAGGQIYLSHQTYVEILTTNGGSREIFASWPTGYQKSYLDVVDYADARHPAVRLPVSIPGTLQGISHNGGLLYTVGFHRSSTNWYDGAEALDASAYDGVAAYFVDSISLSNVWQHPVLVNGTNLFLGRSQVYFSSTNTSPPALETWTLSSAGKFTKLGSAKLPSTASDLVAFPGLLAAQVDWTRVQVFDLTDPAALRQVGEGPLAGCSYFNLRHADAARARALWLPLDAYGVTKVPLSP